MRSGGQRGQNKALDHSEPYIPGAVSKHIDQGMRSTPTVQWYVHLSFSCGAAECHLHIRAHSCERGLFQGFRTFSPGTALRILARCEYHSMYDILTRRGGVAC